jgi:hypothetical protein
MKREREGNRGKLLCVCGHVRGKHGERDREIEIE